MAPSELFRKTAIIASNMTLPSNITTLHGEIDLRREKMVQKGKEIEAIKMRVNLKTIIITAIILTFGIIDPAFSQTQYTLNTLKLDEGSIPQTAKIEDVAWIAGNWQGEAFGGIFQEVWSKPLGGSMMGMFKLVKDGKVSFCEILTISEESKCLILKLKHFNADLTGWEEKDEYLSFPLVKISSGEANFEGLTFRKIVENKIMVFLAVKNKDGTTDEVEFIYNRR